MNWITTHPFRKGREMDGAPGKKQIPCGNDNK